MPDPCPHLPVPAIERTAASIHEAGADRGLAFYLVALEWAQSLWLAGLPARALLAINRAFAAEVRGDDPLLTRWPLPYGAVAWILRGRTADQFIGNPRRHYQHLATRMVEPRRDLRAWRAWGCWALARHIRPDDPADEKQLAGEGIVEPGLDDIQARLDRLGLPGEARLWRVALDPAHEEAAAPKGAG